ncbi:MAG: NAD(+)/NADH kinase [Alistipes sp.]|jgi:NAD+ kinase|nr:NAD(+)/NADH kinase [Alistipes sp.]
MKIFIYCRPRDYTTRAILDRFLEIFGNCGLEWSINKTYADHIFNMTGLHVPSYETTPAATPDGDAMMISIGGDGTFLEAVRSLRGNPMPIVGLNAGRLGFLASISPKIFTHALEEIRARRYTIESRTMLTVEGDFPVEPDFPCALNEFTIHRHTADMIEVSVSVDGKHLVKVRGDGAIASTPTGSTAYSLSAGGPMVAPASACFVCTAIAPHNFSIRPLVLPDSAKVGFQVHSRGGRVQVSLDNVSYIVDDGASFTISKSKYHTFLAHVQNISFYDTLRDKVMWGLDTRDNAQEKFWTDN